MAHYIGLLLFTGMRRGEASSLKWSDVDFNQKTFMLHDTKNGEDFVIPMSVPVHGLLKAQQQTANGSEWVFPARNGTGHMLEPRKALERLSEEIGYRFTSHTLRHTFGSVAFGIGFEWGIFEAQFADGKIEFGKRFVGRVGRDDRGHRDAIRVRAEQLCVHDIGSACRRPANIFIGDLGKDDAGGWVQHHEIYAKRVHAFAHQGRHHHCGAVAGVGGNDQNGGRHIRVW